MERVTDFYSIKNRNKRNSFRRGTPDAIRDAPVRSPHKADNKKQTPQSNTVDYDFQYVKFHSIRQIGRIISHSIKVSPVTARDSEV